MNRRGFITGLGGILLAGAAPAIVRADSLMRIVPVETTVLPVYECEIGRWEGVRIIETWSRLRSLPDSLILSHSKHQVTAEDRWVKVWSGLTRDCEIIQCTVGGAPVTPFFERGADGTDTLFVRAD